jgi:hypothetical protein
MREVKFKVTEQDIKLVREVWLSSCRFQIDEKRPFGNSDVLKDILRKLDIKPVLVKNDEDMYSEEQEELAEKMMARMPIVLQILIRNLSIEPIEYECTEYDSDWTPMKKCKNKDCKHNGEYQSKTNFSKHSRSKDGLQRECKDCDKIRDKKRREENPEEIKKYRAKWRERNPNYNKEWEEKNPNYHKEYNKRRKLKESNG